MTKLFLSLLFTTAAFGATFTGTITDSMCLQDHSAMNMGAPADCVRACVKGHGAKYVLYDGKNTYKLSDQKTPEQFAAAKVKITGKLFEKTGVIEVEKIEAVK